MVQSCTLPGYAESGVNTHLVQLRGPAAFTSKWSETRAKGIVDDADACAVTMVPRGRWASEPEFRDATSSNIEGARSLPEKINEDSWSVLQIFILALGRQAAE